MKYHPSVFEMPIMPCSRYKYLVMQSITCTKANRPIIYNKVKAVTATEGDSEARIKSYLFSCQSRASYAYTYAVKVLVYGLQHTHAVHCTNMICILVS